MNHFSNLTSNSNISIIFQIRHKKSKYDKLLITKNGVSQIVNKKSKSKIRDNRIALNKSCGDSIKTLRILIVYVDAILIHYVVEELKRSLVYRTLLIKRFHCFQNVIINEVRFQLVPANKEIIDYQWNERTTHLAWEKLEVDHALSWLSTLGGAFSALGDYFTNCALIAGKISYHQLKLALRLGDPNVMVRCKLYFSLSLIQRGYLREAKRIIRNEYQAAKSDVIVDNRLIKMCLGIWAKLKYEYQKRKLSKP